MMLVLERKNDILIAQWILAFAWPSAGFHGHLGNEQVDGRFSLCPFFSLCLSVFQITNK